MGGAPSNRSSKRRSEREGKEEDPQDKASEFIDKENKEILGKKKGRAFITRETASFVGYRDFPEIGFGLSGSSQPDLAAFKDLKSKHDSIADLDLREEPHFFADGKPLCYEVDPAENSEWYHTGRKACLNMEKKVFQELASPLVIYEHVPGAYDEKDVKDPDPVPFSTKATEEDLCKEAGVLYRRVTITDGQRPKDEDVEHALQIFKNVVQNKAWLHIHCRDGHGRTTTVMAMYDIFWNAKKNSLPVICARHTVVNLLKLVSDPNPVDKTPPTLTTHGYLMWTSDRADFLMKFYEFCFINYDDLHSDNSQVRWVPFANKERGEYRAKSTIELSEF